MLGKETDSESVFGPVIALELGTALAFGCDSDPRLGFGLVLGLIFEDCLGLLLLANWLEFDLKANPCLELEPCLDRGCSLSPVFELDVAWETADGMFMLDLWLSVRWDMVSSQGFNWYLPQRFWLELKSWLGFSWDIGVSGLELGSRVGSGSDLSLGLGYRLGLGLAWGLRSGRVP